MEMCMYLSGEDTAIELKVGADIDEPEVCRYFLTHRNGDDIARNEELCLDLYVGRVTENQNVRGQHSLDGGHDAGSREILPCIEDCLNGQHQEQNNSQSQIRGLGFRITERLPERYVRWT